MAMTGKTLLVAAMCIFLSQSLYGCGCDTQKVTDCVTALGLEALDCAKMSACYKDNSCCDEDGVKDATKKLCALGDKAADDKCA